jgi:hypothetical protein
LLRTPAGTLMSVVVELLQTPVGTLMLIVE